MVFSDLYLLLLTVCLFVCLFVVVVDCLCVCLLSTVYSDDAEAIVVRKPEKRIAITFYGEESEILTKKNIGRGSYRSMLPGYCRTSV